MKKRKWQKIIAVAASAAIVLGTNGMQTLLQECGRAVYAQELEESLILEEDSGDEIGQSFGWEEQEADVLTAYEEPEISIEEIEISTSEEAERAAGTILPEETESEKMLVDIRLTEDASGKNTSGTEGTEGRASAEQGSVQWMHILAQDRSEAAQGEAAVRIYLVNPENQKPAVQAEVFLFSERQDQESEAMLRTAVTWPAVLKQALNGTQELSVSRVKEYEADENGNKSVTADYLEFTLPAGGCAEFAAALYWGTEETTYEYRVSAHGDAMQYVQGAGCRVLYEGGSVK